jgi:hypothetical protein
MPIEMLTVIASMDYVARMHYPNIKGEMIRIFAPAVLVQQAKSCIHHWRKRYMSVKKWNCFDHRYFDRVSTAVEVS